MIGMEDREGVEGRDIRSDLEEVGMGGGINWA